MTTDKKRDVISPEIAVSLAGLFQQRVARAPHAIAYRYFEPKSGLWLEKSWQDMAGELGFWRAALAQESLQPGDRVAVMLSNSYQWVLYEQAALAQGLVVVPLYVNDRADNVSFILQDTSTKCLLIEDEEHWQLIQSCLSELPELKKVVVINGAVSNDGLSVLTGLKDWLSPSPLTTPPVLQNPDSLATIVYTSGTVGRPKGVMLSHSNILWNAHSGQNSINVFPDDLFLSFLPLSHTLERTIGYYLPMMTGATVAYARSVALLAEDLLTIKPTVLISVPRIYERVYAKIKEQLEEKSAISKVLFNEAVEIGWQDFLYKQQRESWHASLLEQPVLKALIADKVMAKLGGRIRVAICGGAPLSKEVAKLFVGLGLPLCQGYGLTETSPVISVNRLEDNDPASVGTALPDAAVKIGQDDELLARTPGVMLGYWRNEEATSEMIDEEGWLHTGDKARIENGHIYITGRLKEIIVLSNGEKVSPNDMEMAIMMAPLFEQVMVIGEGRPYLSALIVLNPSLSEKMAKEYHLDLSKDTALSDENLHKDICERITELLHGFPGYAQIRRVHLTLSPWTVENGLLTPTLKLRRNRIIEENEDIINRLYAGHD
ncbi:MAG: AMP-dependent synthetase/ligase [Gammaproteobacteria bacterium]